MIEQYVKTMAEGCSKVTDFEVSQYKDSETYKRIARIRDSKEYLGKINEVLNKAGLRMNGFRGYDPYSYNLYAVELK